MKSRKSQKAHYDPLKAPEDLAVIWYDASNDIAIMLSEDSVLDSENHTVKVSVAHFSVYGVVSRSEWLEMWGKRLPTIRSSDVHYNIVLAMDCSGSMYGSAMTNSISSAQNLVDTLNSGDYISVVAFSDYASAIVERTEITDESKITVKTRISMLGAMGGTNIDAVLRWLRNFVRFNASMTEG